MDKANKGRILVWMDFAGVRSTGPILHLPAPEDFCPTNELTGKRKNNNKLWQ